jgi:hypothetical protein
MARASRELGMLNMTVWKVLRLVQALTSADRVKRREFCEKMQLKMEEDGFVERLISDEATFYIGGKMNRHNDGIWGTVQTTRTDRAPA